MKIITLMMLLSYFFLVPMNYCMISCNEKEIQKEIIKLQFDNNGWEECKERFDKLTEDAPLALWGYYPNCKKHCQRHIDENNKKITELNTQLNGKSFFVSLTNCEKKEIEYNRIHDMIETEKKGDKLSERDKQIYEVTKNRLNRISKGEL